MKPLRIEMSRDAETGRAAKPAADAPRPAPRQAAAPKPAAQSATATPDSLGTIMVDHENDVLYGAADPRRIAYAVGR